MQHAQIILDDFGQSRYIPEFPILYDAECNFSENKELNVNPEHIKYLLPIQMRYYKFPVNITDIELMYFLLEEALSKEIKELGLTLIIASHPRIARWLQILHIKDRNGMIIYQATLDKGYYGRSTPALRTVVDTQYYPRPIVIPLAAIEAIRQVIVPHLYGSQHHYLSASLESKFKSKLWDDELCQTVADYFGRLRGLSDEDYFRVGAAIRMIDRYIELTSRYFIAEFYSINHFVLVEMGQGIDFIFNGSPSRKLRVIYYENNKLRIHEPLREGEGNKSRRKYEIILDDVEPEPEEPDPLDELFDSLGVTEDGPTLFDMLGWNDEDDDGPDLFDMLDNQ